jgi:hypothetical protein
LSLRGGIISTLATYCGHWMSNLLSDIKRAGFILPKELLFSLDISSEVIKSVLSLKIDAEFTTVFGKCLADEQG